MIGTCTKWHQLYDTCCKTQQAQEFASNTKEYKCELCECGRSLLVEQRGDGFDLTLVDPEIEFGEFITLPELADRLTYADNDEMIVYGGGNQGGLYLTDEQLANLRQWAGIPAPYKFLTAAQVRPMFAAMDKSSEDARRQQRKEREYENDND